MSEYLEANLSLAKSRTRRFIVLIACSAVLIAGWCDHALALVVATNDTTVNPASYSGWTQGDPGWSSVTNDGANYVYLGNGWVLSAWHVGVSNSIFDTGTFSPIAGQNFSVRNPPPSMVNGMSLSAYTDLQLIRVSGDPGLPAVSLATQSPPTSGNSGSQIMFVGHGPPRIAGETNWSVNTSGQTWTWTVVSSGGNFRGYQTTSPSVKAWGTNRLANPGSATYQNAFKSVLNSTTAVMELTEPDNSKRDVITMISSFDQPGQNGALPQESQGVSGDSGSAVFYKNGSQWQLAGIVNSVLVFNNQSVAWGVYGDATTFSDISYYNKAYQGSICDIMKTCGNYSTVGDVNVDGVVSGNGTGPASSDDVTAFVAGWNYTNGATSGDYDSWTHGDLNRDGTTNVADFFLLRNALNGQISSGALAALFGSHLPGGASGGSGVVPEPHTAMLAIFAAALAATTRRDRRRAALASM